jgi:hypothetical protein
MEYLALSYPGAPPLRLIEPRTVNTHLPGDSGRRGERAPPGDRRMLVYDEGKKGTVTEDVADLPVRKPLNSPKIYVLQSRTGDTRGSPYQEALMAYRQAQMMGEPETRHYLDIRV